jgi:hypothetical protein
VAEKSKRRSASVHPEDEPACDLLGEAWRANAVALLERRNFRHVEDVVDVDRLA